MKIDLQNLRELPRGPEQKSLLDQIAEQLSVATNSTGLHEKLVRWGWVSPAGQPLSWHFWVRSSYF